MSIKWSKLKLIYLLGESRDLCFPFEECQDSWCFVSVYSALTRSLLQSQYFAWLYCFVNHNSVEDNGEIMHIHQFLFYTVFLSYLLLSPKKITCIGEHGIYDSHDALSIQVYVSNRRWTHAGAVSRKIWKPIPLSKFVHMKWKQIVSICLGYFDKN